MLRGFAKSVGKYGVLTAGGYGAEKVRQRGEEPGGGTDQARQAKPPRGWQSGDEMCHEAAQRMRTRTSQNPLATGVHNRAETMVRAGENAAMVLSHPDKVDAEFRHFANSIKNEIGEFKDQAKGAQRVLQGDTSATENVQLAATVAKSAADNTIDAVRNSAKGAYAAGSVTQEGLQDLRDATKDFAIGKAQETAAGAAVFKVGIEAAKRMPNPYVKGAGYVADGLNTALFGTQVARTEHEVKSSVPQPVLDKIADIGKKG